MLRLWPEEVSNCKKSGTLKLKIKWNKLTKIKINFENHVAIKVAIVKNKSLGIVGIKRTAYYNTTVQSAIPIALGYQRG